MTDNISVIGTNKLKDMGIPIGNGTDNDCSKTNTSSDANREIAKLLLTLHASGTSAPPSSDIAAFGGDNQKAEDLSVRVTNNGNNKTYNHSMQNEMALDLTSNSSNSKPAKSLSLTSSELPYSAPLPASISKIVKSATSGVGNTIIDLTGGGSMASITKAGNAKYNTSNKSSAGNSSLATVTVKPSSKLQQIPQSLQINQSPATTTSGKESNASQAAAAAAAAAASYPFYPQLASMANQLSPSTLSNLDKALSSNANYLLQNLLLGKIGQMQQIATGTTTSNSTDASSSISSIANSTTLSLPASSLPTQPIPAQALALPTIPVSIKPPASVLKGTTTNTIGLSSPNHLLSTQQSGVKLSNNPMHQTIASPTTSTNLAAASNNIIAQISSTTSPTGSSNANPLQLVEGNTATNIPLLCGQIVAQLNGLLFLVHGLNNSTIELNLQQQLIAIYTRLQEVVAMVEQAKNQQQENGNKKNEIIISSQKQGKYGGNANVTTINTTSNINNEMIQKELEKIKDSKLKEEEKIAKHIQEYQRQLLQQQNINSCLKTGTTITPIPATSLPSTSTVTLSGATANLSALTAGDSSVAAAAAQAMAAAVSNSLASLLKPQGALSDSANEIISDQMHQEADSNSLLLTQQERDRNRRRGRPPKTSAGDLAQIYNSPEPKRSRSSSINTSDGVTVTLAPATSLPTSISQTLSLNVPSGIVADLSINRPTMNGRDLTQQMNLNGLGAAASIINGGNNGTNTSPASNGTNNIMITSNGTITPSTGGGGKGGKGIRNRVFCGECPGCLQNDDCGKCRYCKDKTKFGGQNRLRQKCLHRRCQMDTHRKRNSTNNNNGNGNSGPTTGSLPNSVSAIVAAASAAAGGVTTTNNAVSSSPSQAATNGLYSGVDLARLAAQASQQHQLNLNAAAAAAAAQVSLEHQQNIEKEASTMLNNEVSITTATTSNKEKNDASNVAQKEGPIVIGTTLNVPKVKTSSVLLLDDHPSAKDPEDLNLSSMVRRSTRRSQRSSAAVADLKIAELQGQQRPALRSSSSGSINGTAPANSVSSASDDEGLEDVSRNGPGSNASVSSTNSGSKSKSRIDKWKAKHEAMLKMAENNKNTDHDDEEDHIEGEGKEIGKVEDEDEDDDMLINKDSSPGEDDNEHNDIKSSITSNGTKKRSNGMEDDSKPSSSKKARLRNTRSSSSLSNKDEENTDDENDELDESEVEIPNIEPNGVCINLGEGDDDEASSGGKKNSTAAGSAKLNMVTSTRSTRHTAMQQVLSV